MAATINESSATDDKRKSRLFLASVGAIAYLSHSGNDSSVKWGIVTYAGPVNATTLEEAELIAQQCLLKKIFDQEQRLTSIEFSEGTFIEIFQSDLKQWMKMAQARARD